MTSEISDCAIIGGGLAGLTLAIQLADEGFSVILFEKEKYPFHKVCGEYVSMESYDFMERIGFPFSSIDLPLITEVSISAPNGNSITRKLVPGGFGISRYTLDAILAELAVKKGVVLLEETKVTDVSFADGLFTVAAGQNEYKTKVACGAFGKRSLLDKKLNRTSQKEKNNYVAVKYHVLLDFPDHRVELHNFKDGYCGIAKVNDNKYCMCYLTNSQHLRDNDSDIQQMEQNVLMKNPHLKKYFSEAVFLNMQPYTISQVTFSEKSAVDGNMLMIGDAGGNIAPLCGNGMSMAMHASYLAFRLIGQYLHGDMSFSEMLHQYETQWNKHFLGRIKVGQRLQYLFGKESLTKMAVGVLSRIPLLADALIARTHGSRF